ncbi:MAG: ABC transporter substrate-binding protein, partial [Flavihumibacter sp.]
LKISPVNRKVLFVYARGAGSLQVAGKGTALTKMIELAGGTNAVDFDNFKPLTSESLVAANPDVIVLFDSGLKSVGGPEGFLQVPGVSLTNAGKNKKIVSMDGAMLSGFGLRLPQAIAELNQKIKS